MKSLQAMCERIVDILRSRDWDWKYDDKKLSCENLYVQLTGEVVISYPLHQSIPFDWTQRRSIRRAVTKRHREMEQTMIREFQEMVAKQARESQKRLNELNR